MFKEENRKPEEEEEAEEEEISVVIGFDCIPVFSLVTMISWPLLCCLSQPACSHLTYGYTSDVYVNFPGEAALPFAKFFSFKFPIS